MIFVTADLLQRAMGCARGVAATWERPLRDSCALYDITTPARLTAYLATIGHESANLTAVVENLNYSVPGLLKTWPTRYDEALARLHAHRPEKIAEHVYGGRMGNSQPGDGWKYRGRGVIQVTGKANYEAITDLLRSVQGAPDFVKEPGALAEPKWAAMASAAWWRHKDLNNFADQGDFKTVTRRVNGGLNGWDDRQARYAKARGALHS